MEKRMNGLSREFIIHPGETIKEIIDDRGMSQRELAARTGVTEAHISNIIKGQKNISVSFAKKLEYALAIDASFWINLQANYDKELADFEEYNNISVKELEILKKLSGVCNYLKEKNFVEQDAHGSFLIISLRQILNISSLVDIPKLVQLGAYRIASPDKVDPHILYTWLRICDLLVEEKTVDRELDIDKLITKLPRIKNMMRLETGEIEKELKAELGACGIKFAIVRAFPGVPVQGVIKTNKDKSLSLIITNRGKSADVFWFTFFHEIGHIINGDIVDRLIDYEASNSEIESKADSFASNILINDNDYRDFVEKGDFSKRRIREFSLGQGIENFILIGRLQKEGYLKYYDYQEEKLMYDFES